MFLNQLLTNQNQVGLFDSLETITTNENSLSQDLHPF
ncbi:unnamed protein product [Paramecium pentaurelia]|uniref:Uncharacterized protein n=1 Tax=Paramecium pentaurelia TaxID=43138 RepID=A0A8S1XS73_9CILI|nr:unnamed protein product [Paramecium pentaurelia]